VELIRGYALACINLALNWVVCIVSIIKRTKNYLTHRKGRVFVERYLKSSISFGSFFGIILVVVKDIAGVKKKFRPYSLGDGYDP